MMTRHNHSGARRGGLLALAASVLVLGGCDGLFDVDNPTNILDEELADPQLLTALANTPEGAVSLGYDQSIQHGEVVGDAATHVSTNTTWLELDAGIFGGFNAAAEDVYNDLARGRWIADDATSRLEELLDDPGTDARVGVAYFWTGIARITLATLFEEVPFDGGAPSPPAEVIRDAIERFERSVEIAAAAGDPATRAAALGQIARSYRDLYYEEKHSGAGENPAHFSQAADFARQALSVQPEYRKSVHYSPPGSQNNVFTAYSTQTLYNVMDPRYANRIDPVSGNPDPRIPHDPLLSVASDGREIYEQQKYSGRSSPIPVSRWQEAQLIIAEEALLSGDLGEAVSRINAVRGAAGLPDFSAADADAAWDQLLYERETEFFLENRRWADMRYYELIPPRWIPAMQQQGVNRRWPVSDLEKASNPHYRGSQGN